MLTGAVVLGGIRRIGAVAEKLVPAMAICYIIAVLFVLAVNFALPGALMMIITSAFTPTAATGGFIGATVMMGIQRGVARGIFSTRRAWAPLASRKRLAPPATRSFPA